MPDGTNPQVAPDQTTPPAADPAKAVEGSTPPSAKMVPESDLLAVKAGRESVEKKLAEVESTYKSKVSETETKLFATEAKVKDLEEKLNQANLTAKEHAAVKAQLDAAAKSIESLNAKALDYRKKVIATTFQIPVDTLNGKTMEQLDLFEDALKALAVSKGSSGGGYAAGAGGGGGAAKVETSLDRAKRIIADHEHKVGSMRVSGNNRQ